VAMAPGWHSEQRAETLRLLSTLFGAVVVARAVGVQSTIRTELLDAVRADGMLAPILLSTELVEENRTPKRPSYSGNWWSDDDRGRVVMT